MTGVPRQNTAAERLGQFCISEVASLDEDSAIACNPKALGGQKFAQHPVEVKTKQIMQISELRVLKEDESNLS